MRVLVTGATGFVGPQVVAALRDRELDVRVLVRNRESAAGLDAEVAVGDVTEPATLPPAVTDCSHVIHLVAIIRGRPADFDRVIAGGTRNLVAAAQAEDVGRFVLMSALGTSEQAAESVPYYAAKWKAEQTVLGSGLEYTILRPSFIFGRGGALPTFIRQVRLSPVVTVIGDGSQRSQPIAVEDVASTFALAVDDPRAANHTFELGGPDTVDWNELYRTIARVLGKERRLVHIPFVVARLGALLTERLPGAPLTADQVTMLRGADNVVANTDAADTFDLPLVSLEEQIRSAA